MNILLIFLCVFKSHASMIGFAKATDYGVIYLDSPSSEQVNKFRKALTENPDTTQIFDDEAYAGVIHARDNCKQMDEFLRHLRAGSNESKYVTKIQDAQIREIRSYLAQLLPLGPEGDAIKVRMEMPVIPSEKDSVVYTIDECEKYGWFESEIEEVKKAMNKDYADSLVDAGGEFQPNLSWIKAEFDKMPILDGSLRFSLAKMTREEWGIAVKEWSAKVVAYYAGDGSETDKGMRLLNLPASLTLEVSDSYSNYKAIQTVLNTVNELGGLDLRSYISAEYRVLKAIWQMLTQQTDILDARIKGLEKLSSQFPLLKPDNFCAVLNNFSNSHDPSNSRVEALLRFLRFSQDRMSKKVSNTNDYSAHEAQRQKIREAITCLEGLKRAQDTSFEVASEGEDHHSLNRYEDSLHSA